MNKKIYEVIDEACDSFKETLSCLHTPFLHETVIQDGYKIELSIEEYGPPKPKIDPDVQLIENLKRSIDWNKQEQPMHFRFKDGRTVWMTKQMIVWGKSSDSVRDKYIET